MDIFHIIQIVQDTVVHFLKNPPAVFFTLTDRASTIHSNILRGCQSGTWSAGQYNGGFLPGIILLTQDDDHWGTPLYTM